MDIVEKRSPAVCKGGSSERQRLRRERLHFLVDVLLQRDLIKLPAYINTDRRASLRHEHKSKLSEPASIHQACTQTALQPVMKLPTLALLFALVTLVGLAHGTPTTTDPTVRQAAEAGGSSPQCGTGCPTSSDVQFVRGLIREGLADPSVPVTLPGIIRVGFHDCFPGKCDGSIRFELDRPANTRVAESAANFLASVADREDTCLSLADTIQVATEEAMRESGGPIVRFRLCRSDATEAGPDGKLPSGRGNFEDNLALYEAQGFVRRGDLRLFVASQCGGHALGAFGGRGLNFTPNPDVFDNAYAKNLVALKDSGEQLPDHNTLGSDRQLIESEEALAIVREYADDLIGIQRLRRDFRRFLDVQSRL